MSDEVSPQANTDSELTPETDGSITLTRRMVAAAGVVILLAVGASSFALGRVTADDSSDLGDHPALAQREMRERGHQGGMRERGQQGGMRERGHHGGPGQSTPSTTAPVVPEN